MSAFGEIRPPADAKGVSKSCSSARYLPGLFLGGSCHGPKKIRDVPVPTSARAASRGRHRARTRTSPPRPRASTPSGASSCRYPSTACDAAVPHPPMNPCRHRNATRRLVGVALLALLVGQWVVLAHAIAHARTPAAVAVSAETDHGWGHHAGTPACDLVDHLLTGQAPGTESASANGRPAAAIRVAPPLPSIGPGRASRAYEARGPPRA